MTAADRRRTTLANHGVPQTTLDNLTFEQVAYAHALLAGWNLYGQWTWADCPEELKVDLFGKKEA